MYICLVALSAPVLLTTSCLGQTLLPKHIETPIYPPLARIARIQGTVTIKVTIDADGNVTKAEVANDAAHPIAAVLQESAIDNMQHWTFEKPPSAPFTQVLVYRYAFDGSLPANEGRNPITKVNIDLPDRVTILANDAVAYIYFTNFGVRSVKCLYLWHCGSRWGGEDFYFYRVRSARCLYMWRCGLHRRIASGEQLTGSMELVCGPPFGLDLHLSRVPHSETLVAHLWMAHMNMYGVKNTPHPAPGRWCSADNHCETVQATITFEKLKFNKEASGKYVVEFSDGHKQEGSFHVVRTPQREPFLCE